MGSAGVGGTEHAPLRIEPEVGQRPENNIKPPASDRWDVLHEDESRSHFANDPVHLPPEAAALSCEACAFAGDADVLAGKATGNDIDSPSPCGPVELGNVIVDLQLGRQPTFVASCLQNGAAVRVDLHRAHRTVAQQHAAEDAAACAGEQMQFPHVTLQTIAWRPLLRCRRMPLSATRPHSTSSARRVRMPLADCIGALLLR
jgi:hypothetical protein